MKTFEDDLARATAPETRDMLGAIGLVVNSRGNTLYHHASGLQSLAADAPPLHPDSAVALGSAGKFITHVAALQQVERGAIGLDDPIERYLPELSSLPLISRDAAGQPFQVRPPTNKITLRHLLLHTSGLSHPDDELVGEYLAGDSTRKPTVAEDAPLIVKIFSIPLIFEPGEGFCYGCSIHWTQLLVGRIAGGSGFTQYIQENIFDPLGMTSSTYTPRDKPDIWNRRLRMVEREGEKLLPADDEAQGLMCSVSDVGRVLGDLISPSPKLLSEQKSIEILLTGQLQPSSASLAQLRSDQDNYKFCAGPSVPSPPLVNWSAAGLVVEGGTLPLSGMPVGTVTWEGMPNVLWAANRERGLAMFFATQLVRWPGFYFGHVLEPQG
ncbi:beta-lactamase/transpeptidase-like protein [Lasiosphaeris hirsuta]|uniref:Beta-lactamase/transpeptidase-like protein n=1 Tax=Lasiosphaeris hirsuta TaxID=260670 RepID=A0AA40AP10_9PEZI|nr:beta-lactamase/transpeptidase-like protein [Lasiosphaeris hirsuta]